MNLALVPFNPSLVIDVGANVGDFYREAAAQWPAALFFLIEGNEACRGRLEPLQSPSIRVEIALLSDQTKTVPFHTRRDAPTCTGSSIYRENTEFYEGDKAEINQIETCTLDSLVDWSDLLDVQTILLKIDVQGSELDVLRGGFATLTLCDAVILEVSLTNYNERAPLVQEVDAFMTAYGWKREAVLQEIVHPVTREHIQDDVLYLHA